MDIIRATDKDKQAVVSFYTDVILKMQDAEFAPGWQIGLYPTTEYLHEHIDAGRLYYAVDGGSIVSAMIVSSEYNEGYDKIAWKNRLEPGEFSVIHTLAVHPDCGGRGIGKIMTRFAIELARESGKKAVRLDVLKGNLPAEKLYRSVGFEYNGETQMFYEDTGITSFELYEYDI